MTTCSSPNDGLLTPKQCQRCRKRKIKCSGDPGNGQGCSNCRSAGTPPSVCTFLRVCSTTSFAFPSELPNSLLQVNSRECETYLTVRGVQVGGRYTPYPSNQSVATRGLALQVHPSNVTASNYVNAPGGYDCYHGLYGQGLTRASYPAYPINYEDEIYNGQSPPYMLPNNNDAMLSTNSLFGPPASPRTWDIFSSSGRSQNSLYSDQNLSSSVSIPTGSFPGSGIPYASNPNEISSSSSTSTIASSMTSLDRILPKPAMGRSQQPAIMMGPSNSLDGLAMTNVGYRNSVPWVGSDSMSGSSQSSDRVMSAGYGSTVNSSGGSADSSITTQDAPFAYVSMSHSSPGKSMKRSAALPDPSRIEPVRKPDEPAAESRTRTLSQESTTSPENSMAEAYGYSGDMVVARRSTRGSISSGTLSNGQEYTRLRPLPTPTPELYRSSQQDSAEYQSHIAHRTSIASLSNSARY